MVWPLAVLDLFREPADATAWSRLHTRQAFVYGIVASVAYLVLLALPLLLRARDPAARGVDDRGRGASTRSACSPTSSGAFVLLGLSLAYRERALRGELFAIPYVTPLADRIFRLAR